MFKYFIIHYSTKEILVTIINFYIQLWIKSKFNLLVIYSKILYVGEFDLKLGLPCACRFSKRTAKSEFNILYNLFCILNPASLYEKYHLTTHAFSIVPGFFTYL